jgi:hypothetical protein
MMEGLTDHDEDPTPDPNRQTAPGDADRLAQVAKQLRTSSKGIALSDLLAKMKVDAFALV